MNETLQNLLLIENNLICVRPHHIIYNNKNLFFTKVLEILKQAFVLLHIRQSQTCH